MTLMFFLFFLDVIFQAKNQFYVRTHMVDESKNEYASQLQNFNTEQWNHFNKAIPHIFKVKRHVTQKKNNVGIL